MAAVDAGEPAMDGETRAVLAAAVQDRPAEEVEMTNEARVQAATERVMDEWLLVGIVRAGAQNFIRKLLSDERPETARLRKWVLLRLQNRVWAPSSPLQAPNPENLPLRAEPVWPRDAFAWLADLEAAAAEIREELLAARSASGPAGFQPYLDPKADGTAGGEEGTDSGQWNVLYLFLNHKRFEENCAKFPRTVAAVERVFPRHYSHAFFSALAPGSHIKPHFGPSNKMLRCHLPLLGLEGARLLVGDKVITYEAGAAVVWDHSFRHEAYHEGAETRVILIVDFWHPDLSDEEVRFLETLRSAKLRVGRQIAAARREASEAGDVSTATNHFDIIDAAQGLLTDDDWWVIKAEADPTTRPT